MDRPPRFGMVELLLYNWRLLPLGVEPGTEADAENDLPSLCRMHRVVPCQRFVCFEEEDWFVRLHVTLAGEAVRDPLPPKAPVSRWRFVPQASLSSQGRLVKAVRLCVGARDTDELVCALHSLVHALEILVRARRPWGVLLLLSCSHR